MVRSKEDVKLNEAFNGLTKSQVNQWLDDRD
ncbi:hypothetical protein predicted by Glimmer/Critica [Lactiplantibacillus plantarum]|nr:hypothetical protein predicted by Glimmer/Critica [Lactiplantibacillus plantarum]